MNLAGLAFLVALQVGQGCPNVLWYQLDPPVCWPVRPRYSDLMPLVEPLPPLNECERLDGDFVEILCFPEWPNMMDLITQDSLRQAAQEEAYRRIGGVMGDPPLPMSGDIQEKTYEKIGVVAVGEAALHPSATWTKGAEALVVWTSTAPCEQSVVPAIQEGEEQCIVVKGDCGDAFCWQGSFKVKPGSKFCFGRRWTCADHSRVLLSSEDGFVHWCVRF